MIIDDHRLFADALSTILERAGMTVVGTAERGDEAVSTARTSQPDVVLVDIGLPDQSGLVVGSRLLEEFPDLKVIALSAIDDRRTIEEALRLGFHGYLTKETPVARFESAVRSVMDGQVIVPRFGGRSLDADPDASLLATQLTSREIEVLGLLVEGASGSEMAAGLGISGNTVRTHVQSILTKLQVHSRLEAATFAVRHGLVQIPRSATGTGDARGGAA
jgi:two-component system nitrate/nitrite response regulator NarL